jgi:hypothetical protein
MIDFDALRIYTLFTIAAIVGGILLMVFDGRAELWAAVRARLSGVALDNMSSLEDGEVVDNGPGVAHVPALSADTGGGIDSQVDNNEIPRISTRLSAREVVYTLASQVDEHGKFVASGNQVFAMVNKSPWSMGKIAVQDIVRSVQQGTPPPVYRPLTPEHQAFRDELETLRDQMESA